MKRGCRSKAGIEVENPTTSLSGVEQEHLENGNDKGEQYLFKKQKMIVIIMWFSEDSKHYHRGEEEDRTKEADEQQKIEAIANGRGSRRNSGESWRDDEPEETCKSVKIFLVS